MAKIRKVGILKDTKGCNRNLIVEMRIRTRDEGTIGWKIDVCEFVNAWNVAKAKGAGGGSSLDERREAYGREYAESRGRALPSLIGEAIREWAVTPSALLHVGHARANRVKWLPKRTKGRAKGK